MSYLNGVLPLGEVDLALPLLLGGPGGLVLGETAAEVAGELGAEVERGVLLVLVEQTQLGALVGVDDGKNTSNRLANIAAKIKRQYSDIQPERLTLVCNSVPPGVVLSPVFLRNVSCVVAVGRIVAQPPIVPHRRFGVENFRKGIRVDTHILWVLVEAPLAIFWTRSWFSSVFNSSSCLVSSSLFLPQS